MTCSPGDRLDLRLPPSSDATVRFRAATRKWLRTTGASEAEGFDILTATSEAIANAIEHPLAASSSLVALTAVTHDGVVRVSVRDFGAWQHEPQRRDGGYGFMLMRSLMDSVEVLQDQDGTTVVMEREIRGLTSEPSRFP